jgi:hypothetical protein
MKAKFVLIIIVFFIAGFINKAEARLLPNESAFCLQFQKTLFISGDKIWFKNSMASGHDNNHQTILYVDLCGEGSIINSCIIKRENNHWEGNLAIPDSLESGIYLVRAYTGNYDGRAEIVSKLITVINRFGNNKTNESRKQIRDYQAIDLIHEIPVTTDNALKIGIQDTIIKNNSAISLMLDKDNTSFPAGISLSVFKIPDDGMISNSITEPEAKVVYPSSEQTKIFNKLTLCGKVISKTSKEPVVGETVLLSIPDSIPQINYAVTNDKGEFLLDVGDFFGVQDMIVQTLTKNKDMEIILYSNLLDPPVRIPYYISSEVENCDFVALTVKQSTLNKAYEQTNHQKTVSKPAFKYPFYGHTENILKPDRYIDLDNFEEISKELLPLCRVKKEKKEVVLNIYDPVNFRTSESPWIIIDGVPVFDMKILLPLNSQRIRRIETQSEIRCYGALYIDGAISVVTKDGNYSLALPDNAVRKAFDSFEYEEDYPNLDSPKGNLFPDFRDVLYWNSDLTTITKVSDLKIRSSFEKGMYAAVAEAMDKDGNVHRSVFKFNVK